MIIYTTEQQLSPAQPDAAAVTQSCQGSMKPEFSGAMRHQSYRRLRYYVVIVYYAAFSWYVY